MRIVAQTIWYDEHPDDLRDMAASVKGFADAMVAVDGAFKTFPRTGEMLPWSPSDQAQAIADGCAQASVELLLYQPRREGEWTPMFSGNEPDKRNACLALSAIMKPDWVFNIDADMRLVRWDAEAKHLLEASNLDVAEVDVEGYGPRRIMFRWAPDVRYYRTHYVVRNDTRFLDYPKVTEAGNARETTTEAVESKLRLPLADALDLSDQVWFDHPQKRDSWRRVRQNVWYVQRDEQELERL